MSVGEYVSVAQQSDTERADVETERAAHAAGPEARAFELTELTAIYVARGLDPGLAAEVRHTTSRACYCVLWRFAGARSAPRVALL
jgi:VIT1/CCC1 family predicted Fe2+/Mn2+ transporter